MLTFSEESRNGINFLHTLSEAIVTAGSALVNRLTLAKKKYWNKGLTSIWTDSAIKIKRISYDDDFELQFDFLGKNTGLSNAVANNIKEFYIFCARMITYLGLT